jgi:hypothetical protein
VKGVLGTPTYLVFSLDGELVANNPGPVGPAALERFYCRLNRKLGLVVGIIENSLLVYENKSPL